MLLLLSSSFLPLLLATALLRGAAASRDLAPDARDDGAAHTGRGGSAKTAFANGTPGTRERAGSCGGEEELPGGLAGSSLQQQDLRATMRGAGARRGRSWASAAMEELLGSACQTGKEGLKRRYEPLYTNLGGGSFGSVSLWRLRDDPDPNQNWYAVKELNLRAYPEELEISTEFLPSVLGMPFNLGLHEVFVSKDQDGKLQEVFLVSPPYFGGEVAKRYEIAQNPKAKKFTKRPWTRQGERAARKKSEMRDVLAQSAYGLWELHQRGILHLDIKPENMLLASEDSCRLTLIDYGLIETGCVQQARCADVCHGSPAFLHPKLDVCLIKDGPNPPKYSYEADWWSWAKNALIVLFGVLPNEQIPVSDKWKRDFFEKAGDSWAEMLRVAYGSDYRGMSWTDDQIIKMSSPKPEEHPILSHPFWTQSVSYLEKFGGALPFFKDEKTRIRTFWNLICRKYASEETKENCRAVDDEAPRETITTVKGLCPSQDGRDNPDVTINLG